MVSVHTVSRRTYGVRVFAGLNGPLNPSLNLFDVARVGVDFGDAADTHSEARIRINDGAIIAQPRSKLTSNLLLYGSYKTGCAGSS
jgi:hypothetical protein